MTRNEKLAHEYFISETKKAKSNIIRVVKNEANFTEEEFSKCLHVELMRFDDCRKMRDYYDCIKM